MADEMAPSMAEGEEACMVHVGWAVDGSIDWNVLEEDDDDG